MDIKVSTALGAGTGKTVSILKKIVWTKPKNFSSRVKNNFKAGYQSAQMPAVDEPFTHE